jgi:hypothetical protein
MWATVLIGMSSITVPPLAVSFEAVQSIAPLVLPFGLIYGAFYILLGKAGPLYFKRRGVASDSITIKSVLSSTSGNGHRKNNHASLLHRVLDLLKIHVIGAALLVTIALVALHWSLYSGLVIAADKTYNVGLILVGRICPLWVGYSFIFSFSYLAISTCFSIRYGWWVDRYSRYFASIALANLFIFYISHNYVG